MGNRLKLVVDELKFKVEDTSLQHVLNEVLKIKEPIDKGAKELLAPFADRYRTYPPLEVEYLIQTLNEHIANCLELRMKAQELEERAFTELSDQLLNRNLLDAFKQQLELTVINEPKFLSNSTKTNFIPGNDETIKNSEIVTASDNNYWKSLKEIQEKQIKAKIEDANSRIERMSEIGNGMNYVARFEFLKKLFQLDLTEAYQRARSVSLGLKKVYNIIDEVPAVTDVGYLDKLTLWARDVTYKLEKRLFKTEVSTFAFWLTLNPKNDPNSLIEILKTTEFTSQRANHKFEFIMKEEFFNRLSLRINNIRLRGVNVAVWGNTPVNAQLWRILIKPPITEIPRESGLDPYRHEPFILLPTVTYYPNTATSLASEIMDFPDQRIIHNINPVSLNKKWVIEVEKTSIGGDTITNTEANFSNLLLLMRVAYEKEIGNE